MASRGSTWPGSTRATSKRLRRRVATAGAAGMYASVMLDDDRPVALELQPGTYTVRWFDIDARAVVPGVDLVVGEPGTSIVACPITKEHSSVVHVRRHD
jgi:hypothetical protein